VDAGNLYWKSARLTADELPQQQEKARLMAAALSSEGSGGMDAMLLAEGDVAVGLVLVKELASKYSLPYVASNLDCGDGFPAKDKVITRGGVSIGVLGVVDDRGQFPGCTASDPQAAVRAGLERLRSEGAQVVVLLDALPDSASAGLAAAVPGVDLVVGGTSQPLQSPLPLPGGGLRLGAGTRGRSVGVLGWSLVDGATAWREDSTLGRLASQRDAFRQKVDEAKAQRDAASGETERTVAERRSDYYQKELDEVTAQLEQASGAAERAHAAHNNLVTLDTTVADDPVVQALVDAAKDRIAALAVQAAVGKPLVGPYVGSQACASCHPGPTGQWKSTPHANAYASLIAKKRQFDQACFSCHVTGAVAVGGGEVLGPTHPNQVGALSNVGCESCHGPGSAHVKAPTTPMAMPSAATCVTCHDKAQDDGRFDYAAYLPKVIHGIPSPR